MRIIWDDLDHFEAVVDEELSVILIVINAEQRVAFIGSQDQLARKWARKFRLELGRLRR